jgi:hypothetical protein
VSAPALDVGALLERFGRPVTAEQGRAVRDLSACRTARLGGRVEQCQACGRREYRYNACGNRHCPKCQARQRAVWLEREAGCLLPVEYHHLVFTLPHELAAVAADNPRLVYGLLFAAASASVQELAADPRHLGAQVGLVAVLHTWGQALGLHPHLHVLASGGGLSCDRRGQVDALPCWRSCRPGFFLPVRVLSRLFRGKLLAGLKQAHEQGELRWPGGPASFGAWLAGLYGQEWVVYSQPPCAGPEVVLKYLARYVQRVAISNGRLVRVTQEGVTFRYKDYRQRGREKEMTLAGAEFARRLLQHVLPRGFVRVRHYGLLANRGRQQKLALCRRLLLAEPARRRGVAVSAAGGPACPVCPVCGAGEMRVVGLLPRPGKGSVPTPREDSS